MFKLCHKVTKPIFSCLDKYNILDKCVFLDIETSGFSPVNDNLISVSILTVENNFFIITQFFIEKRADEEELILETTKLFENKNFIVTYNGNSFDLPFINTKVNKYNIDFNINQYIKIDLYNDILVLKNKLSIDNMKLQTIEKYFKIERIDELNGKDIIKLYTSYLLNNKTYYKDLILEHNYEDVYNLPFIFDNILKNYDNIFNIDYLNNNIIVKLLFKNIIIKNKEIVIKLYTFKNFKIDYINYSHIYNFSLDSDKGIITIKIKPNHFNNNIISDFIYLSQEDIELKSYTIVKNMKDTIIPIKYLNHIFYDNINEIIMLILNKIK